jgi:hypothetical protein
MNAMRPFQSLSLMLSLLLVFPAGATTWPMKYEGGTLDFALHNSLKVEVSNDAIIVFQGKKNDTIPAKNITEVNYGNDVHRRVGLAVGVGVVTLGLGALLLLVKTKKHYVGVIWAGKVTAEGATPEKGGIVFKVGKGEYRGFIAALEGLTGLKAVDADIAGPGGTSGTAPKK